jgi:elongation factor P
MKINGSAIRAGNVIEVDGRVWRVIKHNIVSPGKGGAFNQIEIRDVKTGTKSNMKFRSDETVEQLRVEEKELQFLFADGDQFTFMDQESFEQLTVNRDMIGDPADFLTDGMIATMQFIEGQGVVGVELPLTAIGTVVEADAVVKGQTAASSYKPAKLDNGARVMVPPFVATGERIVVNIQDRTYVERARD